MYSTISCCTVSQGFVYFGSVYCIIQLNSVSDEYCLYVQQHIVLHSVARFCVFWVCLLSDSIEFSSAVVQVELTR
jgi:hypothetical protein